MGHPHTGQARFWRRGQCGALGVRREAGMVLAVMTGAQPQVPMAMVLVSRQSRSKAAGLLMAESAATSPRLLAPGMPHACRSAAGRVGGGRLQRESRLSRPQGLEVRHRAGGLQTGVDCTLQALSISAWARRACVCAVRFSLRFSCCSARVAPPPDDGIVRRRECPRESGRFVPLLGHRRRRVGSAVNSAPIEKYASSCRGGYNRKAGFGSHAHGVCILPF